MKDLSPAGAPALEALPGAVIDAAILWSVKLDYNPGSAETLRVFEQWLGANRQHALAWERIGALKQEFTALPSRPLLQALQVFDERRDQRRISRRQALKLLSLTGAFAALGWGAREQVPWQRLVADTSTGVGEQKTLNLADGTSVLLNTDSAIDIDFTGDQRRIILRRGEILIVTGADAGNPKRRPFWVHTPHGRVQALGTRFVVRLDEGRARVAVQKDAVELHSGEGGARQIVRAGETRWLSETEISAAEFKGFESDAWVDGVIAGKHIRLADLLAELERYRPGRIICDERVADLRISGVFHIRDTAQALQFLVQTQPLSVTTRTRYWVTVSPRV